MTDTPSPTSKPKRKRAAKPVTRGLITVSLPLDVIEAIRAEAIRLNRPQSWVVTQALLASRPKLAEIPQQEIERV